MPGHRVGGGVGRTHLTRTNWRTSSERASRSTPRSAAFASNAAHADSHRLPELTSFTGAASSSSKPSSSRWRASETTGATGATPPCCVRARLTAPSSSDSGLRLVPGIAPVWAARVPKCRAHLVPLPEKAKKKPKVDAPKSQVKVSRVFERTARSARTREREVGVGRALHLPFPLWGC